MLKSDKMHHINTDTVKPVIIAAGGITGVQIADMMAVPGPEEIQSYGQLIIQLLIGAATLYRMVRDNRKDKRRRRKNESDTDTQG